MLAVGRAGIDVDVIRELAGQVAGVAGVEVVEVALNRGPRRWLLRLDIDRAGTDGVNLEDCRTVSRELESRLDERELLEHAYTLEVSSPGIDRPIRTPDDVRRNTGRVVDVEMMESWTGRRRFTGVLLGLDGGRLRLREEDDSEVLVPFDGVLHARQHLPF